MSVRPTRNPFIDDEAQENDSEPEEDGRLLYQFA